MRLILTLLASVAVAGTAGAQGLWVGVGAGTAWEWQPASSPGDDWGRDDEITPTVFLAVPIDENTFVRLRGIEVAHDVPGVGRIWDGSIRAGTIGVDYLLPGIFGQAVFSGGVGAYRLDLEGEPPEELEDTKFGWYVGIGEWFTVGPRLKITAEVSWHDASFRSDPRILHAAVGLAYRF